MGSNLDAELTVAQAAFERGYLTVRELRMALILHEELEKVGTPRPLLALLPALPGHQESDLQAVYTTAQEDSQLEETRGLPSPLRADDVPDAIRTRVLERALKPVTQDTERVRRSLATIGIGDWESGEGPAAPIPEEEEEKAALPEAIGGYAVLGEVGRKEHLVRCRVEDEEGRPLVLDWLRAASTPEERQRVARDAQAATRLRHRNLVPVLRSGLHDEQPWWTLDLPLATTLAGELGGGPLEPSQAAWIVERLARGLAAAHAQDLGRGGRLTPNDVWISPEGEPLVVGFDAKPVLDRAGRASVADDVTSLGLLLHEALTGSLPSDPEQAPSAGRPEVPADLDAICLRARAGAGERYPSALHLADDLDLFLSGADVEAQVPVGSQLQRALQERPGLFLGVAAGACCALFVVAGLGWSTAGELQRKLDAAEQARANADADLTRAQARIDALVQEAGGPRPATKTPAVQPQAVLATVWRLVEAIRGARDAPAAVRRQLLAAAYREVRALREGASSDDPGWERVGWLALEADVAEQALIAFQRAAAQPERGLDFLARVDEGRARALLALGQVSKAEDALGKVLPHRRARGEREPLKLLRALELSLQLARRRSGDAAVEALQTEILTIARALPGRGFDAETVERVIALVEDLAAAELERGALAFARDALAWVYARLSVQRPDGSPANPLRLRRAARMRLRLVGLDVALGRIPDRSGLGELARGLEALQPGDPVAAALRATQLRLRSAEHAAKGEVAQARQTAVEAVSWAQKARAANLPGARLALTLARLQVGRTAKPEAAVGELEATLLLARALAAERAADPGPRRVLAEVLTALSALRLARGEVAQAQPLAQEAVTLRRKDGPPVGLGEALLALGLAQRQAGEAQAAERTFGEALELWERLHGAPSPRTTTGLRRALTHVAEAKLTREPREALRLSERALKLQTGVQPIPELEQLHGLARLLARERQPETPQDHLELAYAYQGAKKPAEALGHFAQALADPKLRGDLKRSNLYNAACAACLAAAIDPPAAAARRKQALDWLAEDLKRRHRYVTRLAAEAKRREDPRLKARLAGLMKRWRDHLRWAGKDDPDLASLRDWPEFKRVLSRYSP